MKASSADPRLRSLDDGIVRLGPRTLHLDITNACNTDCITCWDHSPHLDAPRPVAWKRQRADVGFLTALVDAAAALGGLQSIIVSGMGEPFTHPDVYTLLGALKRRGLNLTVITNLVAADARAILELGVDQLLIGIHAASLPAYLAFHPAFGVDDWRRLHDMMATFRAAGRRFKHVQVICAANAEELPAMIRQAATYDAERVNFKLASLRAGTQAVRITGEQRAWLLDEGIAAAEAEAARLKVTHNLATFRAQVESGGETTAPIHEIGCFLGYDYSRITVDRTVLYCCNTEVVVGRLEAPEDFASLWTGPAWQALRARLRAGRYFPGCWQCGKLNENVKLSARFRAAFGEERWRAAIGDGLRLRVLG